MSTENVEIAFLQVHLSVYHPGDKITRQEAQGRDWWHSPWEYQVEALRDENTHRGPSARIWDGDWFKFFGTAIALDLQAFGESQDSDYSCGLAADMGQVGLDVFSEDDFQRIIDLGKSSLKQFYDFGQHAHYILAIRCKWWKELDTWVGPGEYESSVEILGRVDLSVLKLID